MHIIYHMMVDFMPALKDFNLDKHAISWVKPNAQTGMVFDDGTSLLMSNMVADTKDSMSKFSWKDANTYGHMIRKWRRITDEVLVPDPTCQPSPPSIRKSFSKRPSPAARCSK